MAALWTAQLDFILFFYGFAFLLLGLVALAIARYRERRGPWFALGIFGVLHGTSEWLDLFAVIIRDGPTFAALRVGVMTISFVCLLEMARLGMREMRWRVPGRWIHVLLLGAVCVAGAEDGRNSANVAARYLIGLTGSVAVAFFLYLRYAGDAGTAPNTERRWEFAAATGFLLYGIAAGAVTPASARMPHYPMTQDAFLAATGVPIQMVRGLLACFITISVWGIWGERITRRVASLHYNRFWRLQFIWTLSSAVIILLCGWLFTEYLGGVSSRFTRDEGRREMALVSDLLSERTTLIESMARVLSDSPGIKHLLVKPGSDPARAKEELRRISVAFGATSSQVIDRSGKTVASWGVVQPDRNELQSIVQATLPGVVSFSLSSGAGAGDTYRNVGYPVRNAEGQVLGVAILSKSLRTFTNELSNFELPVFLIDSSGTVMGTNRHELLGRAFWPSNSRPTNGLSGIGALQPASPPGQGHEQGDATWVLFDGERIFARRQSIEHSDWSLVMLVRPEGIHASRALGIMITFLSVAIALVYLVGLERRVHDMVQAEKRLQLEELARQLDRQATTDDLTGTSNRLKFNHELSVSISRARRYGVSFSLLLFDVDNFKRVNDSFGHLAGDNILMCVSDITRRCLRESDVHARWGGEEFAVLAPETSLAEACMLAEKLRSVIETHHFEGVGRITCSFGVVQFEPNDTAETLVSRADRWLYQAKSDGRNRVEGHEAASTQAVEVYSS